MFGKTCIAPSILSADFMNLGADVRLVSEGGADWIHVDVMDGHFVPNLTIGPAHVKALKKITDVPLDVHLMIDNPEVQVPWYLEAGADSVTIHCEATDDAAALIDAIHAADAKAGVSINPETDTSVLAGLVGKCDLVLMMSVHPGFGGQSFIESTPERIDAGRRAVPCRRREPDHRGRWRHQRPDRAARRRARGRPARRRQRRVQGGRPGRGHGADSRRP